ncbi:MAG TPA: peptide ABC transporter substrate-binding protein [Chlamydiales bacterium]|nr:peptide ABC transporter substrate-binding protein [Chlamydiales bacterium]
MIGLKLELHADEHQLEHTIPVQFHSSFNATHRNLKKWLDRFIRFTDDSITNDLVLFYSLAKKKYLDHREPHHLSRLILSIYNTRKKLLSTSALSSSRHLFVRWLPTKLIFPFSSRPVMGCLIGFNVMDRCELFDEENILVSLQKHFPNLQFVKESYYSHTSQNENIRICYFEIEKKDGIPFTHSERRFITDNFKEKVKNSIQKLIPSMFIKLNQEEVYKNILILSQEITSINDLPQVNITLDQHSGKEIVFHVTLVQISPLHRFSFKERIVGCPIILDRIIPVRHLEGHQVEASLFRLLLPYESALIRSDGSLDFYAARKKVTQILVGAIGEFRDYNGGLLVKQQELLFSFKQNLSNEATQDPELIETFFHALVPLEKQALLDPAILSTLFTHFLKHRAEKISNGFSFKIYRDALRIFILVRSDDQSITEVISTVVRNYLSNTKDWAYNILENPEEISFNCALLHPTSNETELFVLALEKAMQEWCKKRKNQQTLRIALGHSMFSLDPRIGGETVSSEVLKFLFEGLTRISQDGQIENAAAESIKISPDLKQYIFKLRPSFWNDGSLVSAHDFAYSWKRILSPDFKTNFAAYFYPIKNAKEAKEGKVTSDQVGIQVIDDRTLQIDLVRPTPYFLQMASLPIFSPIHRLVDQERPQWPYQAGIHYPCNGPFQLKVNKPNQAYQLVKNPLYWDATQTQLDQITLTSMDSFQAMQAFMKNEIDWVGNPFGAWQPFSIPEEGQTVYSPNSRLGLLVFNTTIPPFNNPKFRRALSLTIDRSELVKAMLQPCTPTLSVLFPHHCEREHKVFPDSNREEAQKLLHESLSELGISKKDLTIQLAFAQTSSLKACVHVIKRQFEFHLGIQCQLQTYSWNSFFSKLTEAQFQSGLLTWTTPINDPIGMLNSFKFAKEGANSSRWEEPEFQHLLDLSEEEINPFQRSSYLNKAEEILARGMPVVPLFYEQEQAMIRKSFQINLQQVRGGCFNLAPNLFKRG